MNCSSSVDDSLNALVQELTSKRPNASNGRSNLSRSTSSSATLKRQTSATTTTLSRQNQPVPTSLTSSRSEVSSEVPATGLDHCVSELNRITRTFKPPNNSCPKVHELWSEMRELDPRDILKTMEDLSALNENNLANISQLLENQIKQLDETQQEEILRAKRLGIMN
mmetsp:Transcript_34657/g.39267  ORF Transcript_34657/g.39267 Transcript_34657/m.39267 type:complete len:167 (-) Transcript_34657:553-1053(-)